MKYWQPFLHRIDTFPEISVCVESKSMVIFFFGACIGVHFFRLNASDILVFFDIGDIYPVYPIDRYYLLAKSSWAYVVKDTVPFGGMSGLIGRY